MTVIPMVVVALRTIPKGLVKVLEDLEIRRHRDSPDYNITKVSQNIEKSRGDLRRLTVTQYPVKNPSANPCLKNPQKSNCAKRTNHIKLKIDKTQQNSKCRLCGDRDETINHMISECRKLAQKEYKARHVWVGNVIHWEMCKKFKFDNANKLYMHNPAPVLEYDTHKLLWDFDMQTDHLISARRPDLIIINKNIKKRKSAKLSTLPSWLTIE